MQEKIDKILSRIKLPLKFRAVSAIGDEYCLATSDTEDAIKVFFYAPVELRSNLGSVEVASIDAIKTATTRAVVDLRISDSDQTLRIGFEDKTALAFTLKKNKWRLYKKSDFHIECFEDYIEVW